VPAVATQPLHTDAIWARSAAGKFAVTEVSGVGLLAVTDLETGTAAATGANATSSSRVARTATTPRSAVAAARVVERGKR
jgi:hypothetical protein